MSRNEVKRRRWPFRILIAVLLILAVGVACFMLRPRTYTATAYIQILTQRPYFVFSEQERVRYDQYVQTQFAILRSPLIVDKALESPDIARLPTILRQKDKAGWLAKNLKLKTQGESEMATISISTANPEEPDKIVNAVVTAFFEYYATQSVEWNHRLIQQLNLEYNRQQAAARLLQDEVRAKMEEAAKQGGGGDVLAAGAAQNEELLKEIYRNELKLAGLQAELKVLKEDVKEQADLERQIVEKERAARTVEILIADLREKYKEQLADVGRRTVQIVDVHFPQMKLERVDKVLELLQNRITKLETERNAPDQIQLRKKATPPTGPDPRWFW